MTTTESALATAPTRSLAGESTLRKVLLANTEFSVTTGLGALIFGGPIADLFDVEQVWLIRLLGAGLLAFAAAVFFVARSQRPTLDTWSAHISQADLAWVAGTIVVVALGWLSLAGAIVMGVIAVAVLALGLGQLRARTTMMAS